MAPQRLRRTPAGVSALRVTVHGEGSDDAGYGLVLARHPLTLLVPSHLVVLIEEGEATSITVGEARHRDVRLVPNAVLRGEHLSVLRASSRAPRDAEEIPLPRRPIPLAAGQPVTLRCGQTADASKRGHVTRVRTSGDGDAVFTDIPVASGDSGCPLLVESRLAGVCQGMTPGRNGGLAVAVPLSQETLGELRRIQRRSRSRLQTAGLALSLAICVGFAGVAIRSWTSFSLEAVDVEDDGSMLTAHNSQMMSFRNTWSRSFDTPIRRFAMVSARPEEPADHVVVGTQCADERNGKLMLLDAMGRTVWAYAVPDGECVYRTDETHYDTYLVDVLRVGDLDADGENEILAAFVHEHWYPCKLVVLDFDGNLLAEYWHPGYIRTMTIGDLVDGHGPLLVVSASNNALKTSWWNPQVIFAFHGIEIAGQAYPYRGETSQGTELWYLMIENVDPEVARAKAYELAVVDREKDGRPEIRAALTDGRFYYLDANGAQVGAEVADSFVAKFGAIDPPELLPVPLRSEAAVP